MNFREEAAAMVWHPYVAAWHKAKQLSCGWIKKKGLMPKNGVWNRLIT
jgi:hypothetical protein